MKIMRYFTFIFLLTAVALLPNGFAQDSSKPIKVEGRVNDIKYSPDGTLLAVAASKGLYLYDATTLQKVKTLMEYKGSVSTLAWVDKKTLASGGEDKTVRLWNATTSELLNTLKDHEGRVSTLVYLPADKILVSASKNGKVLWQTFNNDPNNIRREYTVQDHNAYSNNSRINGITIRSQTVYTTVGLSRDGVFARARAIETTKSPPYITTYEKVQIYLWNMNRRGPQRISTRHTDLINALAFSPDGNTLASGSADKTIRLHDTDTGEFLHRFEGHEDSITALTYHPGGTYLASGSKDGTIRIWDPSNKKRLYIYKEHTDEVTALAFSLDSMLASGSRDGTILLSNVSQLKKSAYTRIKTYLKENGYTVTNVSITNSNNGDTGLAPKLGITASDGTVTILNMGNRKVEVSVKNIGSAIFIYDNGELQPSK